MSAGWVERLRPRHRWWIGIAVLVATAWTSMYGKIWSFETMDAHRFTARAMLAGSLQLRSALALARPDEQIHDGAIYTNWGYGVPLLQLPFHALALAAGYLHGFFPDRAIYFVYLCAALPLVRAGFDRWLSLRSASLGWSATSETARRRLSWAVTWVLLTLMLVPLMSTRFMIYEETIAYLVI